MQKYFISLALTCLSFSKLWAQTVDSLSTILLEELTVTTYEQKLAEESTSMILSLSKDSLARYGNFNLTDLIALEPGVDVLSSGVGISKPVIRGLYGNRILVLLSGLKFDNQQWQDEHGMGLSDFGLKKVEIIKGPMSILYGTEAIGGVINLIEESKPAPNQSISDYGVRFHSNTLGGLAQAGYRKNNGNNWWRLRLGVENNGDYSDGDNARVLNSRFNGYYLKSTYGFSKPRWTSTNNFMSSFNKFGFVFNDVYTFIEPDNRWSRNLQQFPNHIVLLNILSSENTIKLRESRLLVNVRIQSNERMENEGGGKISLNMHLLTFQYLAKWEKQLSNKHKLIVSNLESFEKNLNYGSRKIVPNASMQESNLSLFLESYLDDGLILENGIGAGTKYIHTFSTPTVNDSEKEVDPFSKFAPYYTAFTGLTYFSTPAFQVKFNIANGVRVPNLAELSADGLHEGIYTYEIGDPSMQNEQSVAFNLYGHYQKKGLKLSISPFYNRFYNYIYLSPTDEEWFGFPVYRYQQQNAYQYGSEAQVSFQMGSFRINTSYQWMIARTDSGHYLPFTPAQKIKPGIYYNRTHKSTKYGLFTTATAALSQQRLAAEEIGTDGYFLLNVGGHLSLNEGKYSLSVAANNLLNTTYYDHLSRYKYFGLNNIGRNITVNFTMQLISHHP